MANVTLTVPDTLHKRMKKHSEIRWSHVVRKSIAKKLDDLEFMDAIANKSRLTEKDAEEIASRINRKVAQRLDILP